MERVAISSPPSRLVANCKTEGTKCGWPSRRTSSRFVESAELPAVAYGLDTQAWLDTYRNFWTSFFGKFWKVHDLIRLWGEIWETVIRCWVEMTATLKSLAEGADLLFTGESFMETAANVAEFYDIPLATLHLCPDTGQWSSPANSAVVGGPLLDDGDGVGGLADEQKGRGRAAS